VSARRALLSIGLILSASLGIASCGGKPQSVAAQVRQWSAGAGFPDLDDALTADFPAVAAGLASGDLKALKTACAGLGIDESNVYDTLVTPSRALTNLLNTALDGLGDDASRCNALTADTPGSVAALRRSLRAHEAEYLRARTIIVDDGGG
jgi:hypothetical protein